MESKVHSVEMSDAEKLVDCIRDHKSPRAAKDALAVCDRWLREEWWRRPSYIAGSQSASRDCTTRGRI